MIRTLMTTLALSPTLALAGWMHPASGYGHMGGFAGWGMMLIMPVLWIGLLFLLIWAIRGVFERRSPPDEKPKQQARDLVRERYARGEISAEELHERLDILDRSQSRD